MLSLARWAAAYQRPPLPEPRGLVTSTFAASASFGARVAGVWVHPHRGRPTPRR